jgi:hypothetical protein
VIAAALEVCDAQPRQAATRSWNTRKRRNGSTASTSTSSRGGTITAIVPPGMRARTWKFFAWSFVRMSQRPSWCSTSYSMPARRGSTISGTAVGSRASRMRHSLVVLLCEPIRT